MKKGYVTTVGMFDGVHLGHRSIISKTVELADQNDLSSLVITFDRHPLSVISPEHTPASLSTPKERVSLIKKLGVDKVVVLPFDQNLRRLTAEEFIKDILIDRYNTRILVIGHDHGFGSDRLRGIDNYIKIAHKTGIRIVEAPYWGHERVCSSAVREYLANGDIVGANRLLGRPYSVTGEVVSGKRIGHTIGFPTANLQISDSSAIPARGVYAALINDENNEFIGQAMVNIGVAPTVTDNGNLTIEAHILDYNGDLYGQCLSLQFINRLRDEQRFDSLDSLVNQLQKDLESTRTAVENYVENTSKPV